jgi:CIC family chloride channel protein
MPDSPPRSRRLRLWLAILGSGVLVGSVAAAFHAGLDRALERRERFEAFLQPLGLGGAMALVAACAVAVGFAVWLTARFAPQAAGSGIQHLEGVERGLLPLWPLSVVWVKFVGGIIGIGGGLVLGREGPTVQMGASLAEHLGRRFGLCEAGRRTLLVVGAGAGLAGAFGAPFAGTCFVVEELKVPLRTVVLLGTLLASALTDGVCRLWLGREPELPLAGMGASGLAVLVPAAGMGVLAGALGVSFNALLLRALAAAERYKRRVPAWALGVAMGAVVGAVAWYVPALPGGGVSFAARVAGGGVSIGDAAWLLPSSFLLAIGSYAVGAPGGIFAPLLVVGALLGCVCHGGWLAALPAASTPLPILAAAAMAGLFAATVRAPLTGTVLLVEMTGSRALALPLLLASLAALTVARALGGRPIYGSLLERELRRIPPGERSGAGEPPPARGGC